MLCFTASSGRVFVLVCVCGRDGRVLAGLSRRECSRALSASCKVVLGELGSSSGPEVLCVDEQKGSFVAVCSVQQRAALGYAVACVESCAGVPCVMRVVREASSMVAIAASSRVGI